MSRFAGLKKGLEPRSASPVSSPISADAPAIERRGGSIAKAREGKKAVVGYFSPELSRAMRQMALDEGTSVQALLGEAIDMLMRARDKHPFAER
ncbi:MAG: ribbon-helix-helix domain-containing protein [Inquilinus sp.]|uniref:ribbon-helix-helix domain-containing protein n=1 Tax=Inquilinus sp. TaxID=1932117 RepID=UPI003F393A29